MGEDGLGLFGAHPTFAWIWTDFFKPLLGLGKIRRPDSKKWAAGIMKADRLFLVAPKRALVNKISAIFRGLYL